MNDVLERMQRGNWTEADVDALFAEVLRLRAKLQLWSRIAEYVKFHACGDAIEEIVALRKQIDALERGEPGR